MLPLQISDHLAGGCEHGTAGGRSDAELVRRAVGATTPEQRKAAFTAIADRCHLTVFRQCARWFPHPEEAQDVCQSAFSLLAARKGSERPDKLAAWLIEIARHCGMEYGRKVNAPSVSWALLLDGQCLDKVVDDEEPRSGSAKRRAHATRLVHAVVAILTERQQQIYQLRYVQELTGKQVDERLGTTGKTGSNEVTQVQDLVLIAQEGIARGPWLTHSTLKSVNLTFLLRRFANGTAA